jgi:recombination associated protein RdgC
MLKNAFIYRIEHWDAPARAQLETRLAASRFVPCGPSQAESFGWVEPRGKKHAALVEKVGGQMLLKLCLESKAVPSRVVKDLVEEQLDVIEKESGRRPRGKAVKALKEEAVHRLLPRAFPKRADTVVWLDAAAQLLVIGAASAKKADVVLTRVLELMGAGLRVNALQTQLAPATAMAQWLSEREAPAGFAIDRDCELKQPHSDKATVRYARHTLDIDEVGQHIVDGKLPTQLALSWASRVSFTLTEMLTLKKIQLLDVVLEGADKAGRDDDNFDADAALMTGELRALLADLVLALGGEQAKTVATPALASTATATSQPSDHEAPWHTEPA